MKQQEILKSDYLDLLFDQRNKSYGGYELRRNYERRARYALTGVLCFALTVAAIPVIAGLIGKKPNEKITMVVPVARPDVLTAVTVYQPPKPLLPKAQESAPKANARVIPTVVLPNDKVVDPPKPKDEPAISGSANTTGIKDAIIAGTGDADSKGKGTEVTMPKGGEGEWSKDEPIAVPDEMPGFDGDLAAYLNSHLNYPESARADGVQGRVMLRFIVAEDGSIVQAEVVRGVAPVLDNEALRVVRTMPRWHPGRVKGKAVKTYFALPINFRLD